MNFWVLVALFILGLLGVIGEFLLPGGIMGTLGGVFLLGSIVSAFVYFSVITGISFLIASMVGGGLAIWAGIYLVQNTSLGDEVILEPPEDDEPDKQPYEHLVGKQGTTTSDLTPGGRMKMDGDYYNVVTQGEFVGEDTVVEVIEVEGNRIVVEEPLET